jgi:ABC-2 type transport system ATP-binding protein
MSSPEAPPPAIRISGLTKDFPVGLRGVKVRAVDGLDLRVEPGEVFGLLGPNGSGKSTTIKVVLGLLEPTSGSVEVFGRRCTDVRARAQIGYLPEAPYFYRHLTGRELVAFYARICGLARGQVGERVDAVIEWVGMKDAARRRVGTYSKGMLQRIGLAQAIVHDPRLLILDEPTAGVDPIGSAEFGELVVELRAKGKTIVLCSHLLSQVESVCDRIAILDRGRMVLAGAVPDLVGEKSRQAIIVEGLSGDAGKRLEAWLGSEGARLVAIEQPRSTLDKVFLKYVHREPRSTGGNDGTGPEETPVKP